MSLSWAVGITLASRSTSNVANALSTLEMAGWYEEEIRIFANFNSSDINGYKVVGSRSRLGSWGNWYRQLGGLVAEFPNADFYMTTEDNVLYSKGLRKYLEKTLWPTDDTAICTVYCLNVYSEEKTWLEIKQDCSLHETSCWIIPPNKAREILSDLNERSGYRIKIEEVIEKWARERRYRLYCHSPSLIKNAGDGSSFVADVSLSFEEVTKEVNEEEDASLKLETKFSKEIDYKKLESRLPPSFRRRIVSDIELQFEKCVFSGSPYFFNPRKVCGSRYYLLRSDFYTEDLYPTNYAILDWAIRFAPEGSVFLDYGCGIGLPLYYLHTLGFKIKGYDNWSQISSYVCEWFLYSHGINPRIVLNDYKEVTVLCNSGIHVRHSGFLLLSKLKWVLLDIAYLPTFTCWDTLNRYFVKEMEYKDLLVVYKKK